MATRSLDTGIYRITNLINSFSYVGGSAKIKKRWKDHLRQLAAGNHHSKLMRRCWDMYGEAAFAFEVLLFCDRDNLIFYEQRAIDTIRPEYNSSPTAGSQLGFRMSDESKQKLSEAAKRTKNFTGKKHSEKSKQLISEKKSGVTQRAEVVAQRKATIGKRLAWPAKRKFQTADILKIRDLIASGFTNVYIAKLYGVSGSVISEIKTGKAYRWVR